MILNLFVFSLASVFALNEYPKELVKDLEEYFHQEESNSKLTPICTKGATRSYYFQLETSEGKFFIKYGEKVKPEVQNQLQYKKYDFPFPPLAKGSSVEKGILVRPFLTEPNFGYEVVEQLYNRKISAQDFITIQNSVFDQISVLYKTCKSNEKSKSKYFIVKISERMKALLSDESLDKHLESADVEGIKRDELFNLPILFEGKKCLSINQMVSDFSVRFEKVPELSQKHLVHGDMHPPNIAKDQKYGIVLIDLSDLTLNEDPCWDLGKWLNHVNRLHTVVQRRESLESDREISFKWLSNVIELTDKTIYPANLKEINDEAIKKMSEILEESASLIRIRAKAAEFVANINTLKRHIELFPKSTPRLLCLITASYLEWDKEMKVYQASMSL